MDYEKVDDILVKRMVAQCKYGQGQQIMVGNLVLRTMVTTSSEDIASESICEFKPGRPGQWECSALGFINGILPALVGKILVMVKNDETKEIWWELRDVKGHPTKIRERTS